jgi:hypothetical protein
VTNKNHFISKEFLLGDSEVKSFCWASLFVWVLREVIVLVENDVT